jgi:DNA polymerase II small subunit/DNA polymerase delta subunit B
MYPALSKLAADKATAFMQDFFVKFAEKEFKDFAAWLHGLGK